MPLVRMKAAPVKTDGERLGNEYERGIFLGSCGHVVYGGDASKCDAGACPESHGSRTGNDWILKSYVKVYKHMSSR